jgi:hypothetical protein
MPTDTTGAILGDHVSIDRVPFDFIKSPLFRSVHADGVIGSLTPRGQIHFAVFCERPALPRRLVFKPRADGSLGEEIVEETISRGTIVREMDVDVFMSPDVAKDLRDWLSDRLNEFEERNAMLKSQDKA